MSAELLIIALVSTAGREGNQFQHNHRCHYRAYPPKRIATACAVAVGVETSWPWPRHSQLGEDSYRYSQRNGFQVLPLMRTFALNLLRCSGFSSIRASAMAVALDISRMLSAVGVSPVETGWNHFQAALPSAPQTQALAVMSRSRSCRPRLARCTSKEALITFAMPNAGMRQQGLCG